MPSFELLLAFFLATCVFAFMPGPAMLYAAAQTLARGRRAGWLASLGIHCGGYVHVIAAALGLSVLFETVPVLYIALKFAGAVYLIWLGYKLFTSKSATDAVRLDVPQKTGTRAFFESILVEVLNPKTALFFLAFLPQFTDPAALFPIWLQLLILGTFVNVMFGIADLFCVYFADMVAKGIKGSQRVMRVVEKTGGAILVGLGLNLALSRN